MNNYDAMTAALEARDLDAAEYHRSQWHNDIVNAYRCLDPSASPDECRDHYVCHAETVTDLKEAWFEYYMHRLDCPADLWPYIDRPLIDRERQHQCHPPFAIEDDGPLFLFRLDPY